MAEKRMFAKSIVLTDSFLDMPMSARCLYFTLGMLADDDGFVGSPKSIMRQCGSSQDDMKLLLSKRYVIGFDSGVIVIKHWRINNYLQNDRHKPTTYQEELSRLEVDKQGSYVELGNEPCIQPVYTLDTNGIPRIDKNSIEENRVGKNREEKRSLTVSNETVCATSVSRVIEAWNSLNLTKIVKITPDSQRGKWLNKRLRDYGEESVLAAIENIRASNFLMGKNSKGWQATFDWFIKPNNFPKVLDGNYDNKKRPDTNNIFLLIGDDDD